MAQSALPSRFPATPNDIATAVARQIGQHMEIGCHLAFGERLDEDVLRRAVRLSLDAEPILGCAYVTEALRAWWERLPEEVLDARSPFSIAESATPDADAIAFQCQPVDDAGPQVAVHLLRSAGGDHVSIRISHVVADGQSMKQYAYLLAELYSRLLAEPDYTPAPNLSARPSSTDVWRGLTPEQRRHAKQSPKMTMPNWLLPRKGNTGLGRTLQELTVARERFSTLKEYGRLRDATLNDLLVTAFFRALTDRYPAPAGRAMSLPFSAEHRRYLSDSRALPISNLAITIWLGVAHVPGESFDQTLAQVRHQTGAWRSALWGVKDAAQATRLAGLGPAITGCVMRAVSGIGAGAKSEKGRTSPVFTNIGVLDDSRLAFGSAVPSSARVGGPAAFGASFVPTISTYRNAVTISMGFCGEDTDPAAVEGVLARMAEELRTLG